MINKILIALGLFLIFMPASLVYAEHVLDIKAFAQHLDISQIESEKFILEINDSSYDVYYGFHGSLDAMGSDFQDPTLSKIIVNNERKSLEIIMSDVPERTIFGLEPPLK